MNLTYDHLLEQASKKAPLSKADFETTLVSDLNVVREYFGLMSQSKFNYEQEHTSFFPAENIALIVAGETLYLLEDTSYRFWNDGLNSNDYGDWVRTLWRYSLIYATGFIISRHQVFATKDFGAWSPLKESLPAYMNRAGITTPTVLSSRRVFDGAAMSYGIYQKLFLQKNISSMIMNAISDAFSNKPNRDNPLYKAYQTALKKTVLFQYIDDMPYFWTESINYFMQHEDDFLPLRSNQPASSNPAQTMAAPLNRDTEESFTQAKPKPQKRTLSDNVIKDAIIQQVQNLYDSGYLTVNGKGAAFQKWQNMTLIVVPKFYTLLSETIEHEAIDEAKIQDIFEQYFLCKTQDGHFVNAFNIIPVGKGSVIGKMNLARLNEDFLRAVNIQIDTVENNQDIQKAS